jgi:hypothetical protein
MKAGCWPLYFVASWSLDILNEEQRYQYKAYSCLGSPSFLFLLCAASNLLEV